MQALAGWFDNWSWAADGGDVSRRARLAAIGVGAACAAVVVWTWNARGLGVSMWLLVPIAAVGIDAAIAASVDASSAFDASIVGYVHALVLAAALALTAFALPASSGPQGFALVGPCLAVASSPLFTRAWAATAFSRGMIAHGNERRAQTRAALAGESKAVIARVEAIEGAEIELVSLEASGERLLRATTHIFARSTRPIQGCHYLLAEPTILETPEGEGYRDGRRVHRLEAIASATSLGVDLEGTPTAIYAAEARAGALVIAGYHVAIVAGSLAIAPFAS